MKPISAQVVEKTWQRIAAFSARQGKELGVQFVTEQPWLATYLMAVDGELFNEDERELLFYLGTLVWQMMAQGDAPLPQVTEQMLTRAEAANQATLESLADASEEEARTAMGKLLQEYAQPEVFKYVVTALMELAQDEGIREENLGMLMVNLKTVIDCLNG